MRSRPQLPPDIEEYRDERWRREGARQVETAHDAERFIEQVGFAACLTDSRRPGPSLYVAVCGRRDAVMPRNVQKDPEASLTWVLKDEIIKRGKVYYAKLARGKTMFLAPRMIPYFHAVWGVRRSEEKRRLSRNARAILHVLRKEWEMSTSDLRDESGVKDRAAFTRGMDELQAAMIVIPSEVSVAARLQALPAAGFERFCQLLRESGFEEVSITGRSGDGGIDGIGLLQVNPLVSFKVLFQCKRYTGSVTPSQVRDFRGAMMGRADKGIIITTGSFTSDARKEAVRDGVPPIELVGWREACQHAGAT
jgi:Restriction endonuclease